MAQLLLLGKGVALICAALLLCYLIPHVPAPVDYTAMAEQKIEQFKQAAAWGTSFVDLLCNFCGESWRAWSVQLLGFGKYLDVDKTKLALEGAALVKSIQERPSPVTFMSFLCQRREIHEKVVGLLQSASEWCCKNFVVVGGEIMAWSLVFLWSASSSKTRQATKTCGAVATPAVNSADEEATYIRGEGQADTSAGLGDAQKSSRSKSSRQRQRAAREDSVSGTPAPSAEMAQDLKEQQPVEKDFGVQQAMVEELRAHGKEAIRGLWPKIIAASFVAHLTFSSILPVVDVIRDKRLEVNRMLHCVFQPSTGALKDALLLPGVNSTLGDQAWAAREALTALPDMQWEGLPVDSPSAGVKLLSWVFYFTGMENLDTVLRTIILAILASYLCWCVCCALPVLRPFFGKLRSMGGSVIKSTVACLSRFLLVAVGAVGLSSESAREYATELAGKVPMVQAVIEQAREYLPDANGTSQVDWQVKAYEATKHLQNQAKQALVDVQDNGQASLGATLEQLAAPAEDAARRLKAAVQPLLSSCGLQHVLEMFDLRMFSAALTSHDWSTELSALLAALAHERVGMMLMQPYFQLSGKLG
eukprot:TRINITY_DN26341_c0_g1_i1.p1 TRINITY_DN26341_c0_g1~~TRINITY_DN26341_c0_g1_i1.p1  ORF type:complete len:589 (-),score=131.83 TRINITY_DN26341_c0_g1_i1:537-2303(-)